MAVLPTGIGPVTGGYQIERSLRFNSADSAYLNRTFTTPTNAKKFTISAWIKVTSPLGSSLDFGLLCGPNSAEVIGISGTGAFGAAINGRLFIRFGDTNLVYYPQVFRDVSAWAHIVVAIDTDQSVQADRAKFYYNGVLQTATSSTITSGYSPALNTAATRYIGALGTNAGYYANGYLAEYNFIDGQNLPSGATTWAEAFGKFNSNTGVWEPKTYTGTYGTNGFYLKFADNSGTTSTTLGKDSSGNGNNWTPNNFVVSPATSANNDSLVDSPTSYGTDTGVGGEVRGNYCTFNSVAPSYMTGGTSTKSNGNLTSTDAGTSYGLAAIGTFPMTTGKWYWEVTCTVQGSYANIGIIDLLQPISGSQGSGVVYRGFNGNKANSGNLFLGADAGTAYGASLASGDILGIYLDMDNRTIGFRKNATDYGVAYSGIPASTYALAVGDGANGSTCTFDLNCGQRPFAYTAPSGFKALCTQNLPTPTIGATSTTQANKYFNVKLWTGNGSTQSITGIGFQPDLVWTKDRGAAFDHTLFDAVRGATIFLRSNATSADETRTDSLTSFNSDGFSVGADAVRNNINKSAASYVSWAWDANGAGSTNTAGTITSTVSANTTSGFSIVTYTGTGAQGTMGHGLGVVPSLIIQKNRAQASNWLVYHSSLGLSHTTYPNWLYLNSTAGEQNSVSSTNHPLYQRPSSSLIYLNTGTSELTNVSGQNHVAYCFAPVAGYSAFGSYTGNGSTTDGPFVYLGFRPRFILLKGTDASVRRWCIVDTARSTYNTSGLRIYAELPNAEDVGGGSAYDIVSNGFKLRDADGNFNASGVTYIYAAFAESPFKYSLAR